MELGERVSAARCGLGLAVLALLAPFKLYLVDLWSFGVTASHSSSQCVCVCVCACVHALMWASGLTYVCDYVHMHLQSWLGQEHSLTYVSVCLFTSFPMHILKG